MQKYFIPLLSLTLLTACQTSSLTDTEKMEPEVMMENEDTMEMTSFTGMHTNVDYSKSVLSFVGKSSIIDHEGKFESYTVTITPDSATPSDFTKATVQVTIDATSVKTDAPGLDGHLQKEEFFDTANYPEITFVSQNIVHKGENMYAISGELSIKNVSQPAIFDVELTDGYLTATYDLPRKDFNVGNDSYGEKLLADTVPVNVHLTLQ